MSAPRRTLIVDVTHLMYKVVYGMGGVSLMTTYTDESGNTRNIETNIQNSISKTLHRWSRGGYDRVAVCFDKPAPTRKAYFKEAFSDGSSGSGSYKAGRKGGTSSMFEALDMTLKFLVAAGVSCYRKADFEADDLVLACIDAAKAEYPGEPIDVVTGDADLLPLVDEDVSVFLVSRKTTWAIDKSIEKRKYVQVTPENYEEIVSDLSMNKTSKLRVPYNAMLLIKLLRGDKSDEIPAPPSKAFPPRRVNDMISHMEEVGIDIGNEFRYGKDIDRMTYMLSPFALEGTTADRWMEYVSNDGDPIGMYRDDNSLDEEFLEANDLVRGKGKDGFGGYADMCHVRKCYVGMNLNQRLEAGGVVREPVRVRTPSTFDEHDLAKEFAVLGIKIKIA